MTATVEDEATPAQAASAQAPSVQAASAQAPSAQAPSAQAAIDARENPRTRETERRRAPRSRDIRALPLAPSALPTPADRARRADDAGFETGTAGADRAEAIRAALLGEMIASAPLSACVHAVTAVTVALFFWNTTPHLYLVGLAVSLIGMAAVVLVHLREWQSQSQTRRGAALRRAWRAAIAGRLGMGLLWASSTFMVFPNADDAHRTLIVAIFAGLISDTALLGPVMAASVAYLTPIVVASVATLLAVLTPVVGCIAVLLVIYSTFILVSAARLSAGARRRLQSQMRVAEQSDLIGLLLRDFEEGTSDWLWWTDAQGRLQHVSPRLAQVTGESAERLQGVKLLSLFAGAAGGEGADDDSAALVEHLAARLPFRDLVVRTARAGEAAWWSLTGKPLHDNEGRFTGWRGVGSDVTAAKASEAQIAYLARFDPLTDLANRAVFKDVLAQACRAGAANGEGFAVLSIDLDHFKVINDQYGHPVGDALLAAVARRLRGSVRDGDALARLDGDEFAVLLRGADASGAEVFARRIVRQLGGTYGFPDCQVATTASVGIAIAPADGRDPDTLLKSADLALYRAKTDGRSTYRFFEAGMDSKAEAMRALEADLRLAAANRSLGLHYQPFIDGDTLRINGFEALLRWNHPVLGNIPPSDFVPIAEATGLIGQIGDWVLETACRDAVAWPASMRVAVNLSAVQFRNGDIVASVAAALAGSGLPAARLELEVTETAFLDTGDATRETLHRLRDLGVCIALDDFGTGYSSLSYLRSFPFERMKIDRSFIKDLVERRDSAVIVEAMTHLAGKLGMTVTAEGVETSDQVRRLRDNGQVEMQGFLFSRPRPIAEIAHLIDQWHATHTESLAEAQLAELRRLETVSANPIQAGLIRPAG
jgi:diguanylate cyclase (GGDEF)-like protein/PAS domain S-box-containing protein